MLDDDQAALHDAAYRYAFRRSLSARLASSAAREAIESLDAGPVTGPPDPGDDGFSAPEAGSDRDAVLRATRAVLERYLPSTLPPRAGGDASLQAALSDLSPADRELLLLHHWDGLTAEDAARVAGGEPGRLPAVEAACAHPALRGRGTAGELPSGAALSAALAAADPAAVITSEDLARSRRGLPGIGVAPSTDERRASPPTSERRAAATPGTPNTRVTPAAPAAAAAEHAPAVREDHPRLLARAGMPRGRVQAVLGTLLLLVVVAGLATALIPRAAPGPAGDVERLFALADVVAVVSVAAVEPTTVDGELRMLQASSVVQIVKGDADGTTLTVDVTGRSTLERPYGRELFPPDRLVFLVRDGDGVLSPIEGEGSVLTLIDRRSPEAATIGGDPAPLPDELRDAIRALPAEELTLDTNGRAPGSLPAESVVGTRPAEGRDVQNLPADRLGTFRVLPAGDGRACVVFEYTGRSVLLRWPEGFSAYERIEVLSYPNGDPRRGRQVLTVLNDRGYPYVDEQRQAPFIGGVPTGEQGECGGQELEVWDIAVEPGTTLLSY
ncbi:hypothetical protein [Arthrobacter sp. SX1312]|uniref:hypothetical protein n=1 Tax=Arthrobacter sp. SX1312 TaxID=2058896 RepID=UPI000CE3A00A|nr:hypothetical protein [Arthrobacter sp. SX1312]